MPGTVFFIVALWAFKRSSPRLETWLLERSPVANTIQDWERDRSIALRTKFIAVGMIWVAIGISIASTVRKRQPEWEAVLSHREPFLRHPVLLVPPLLLLTALSLTWYISSRKTKRTGT